MITLRKQSELIDIQESLLAYLEDKFYQHGDTFSRTTPDGTKFITITCQKRNFSNNLSGGLVINLIQAGDEVIADVYSSHPQKDFHDRFTLKEHEEKKLAEFFLSRGFHRTFEQPLTTLEQARRFFLELGCDHEALAQYPQRYEEYQQLNVSEVAEQNWTVFYQNQKKRQAVKGKAVAFVHKTLGNPDDSVNSPPDTTTACSTGILSTLKLESNDITKISDLHPAVNNAMNKLDSLLNSRNPQTAPITSVAQAKKFYLAMQGNHSRMREEYPERYEEYKRAGVTKAHEERWRKKVK